jgi:hypothetical protein
MGCACAGLAGEEGRVHALVFHMAELMANSVLIRLSGLKWRSTCRSGQGGQGPLRQRSASRPGTPLLAISHRPHKLQLWVSEKSEMPAVWPVELTC